MKGRDLKALSLLIPMILGALVIGNVRASSVGLDTINVTPATITQTSPATFTQAVNIAYSANALGQFPQLLAMQYVINYNPAVIEVDTSACQLVNGINYCGVIPGPYALLFPITALSTALSPGRLFASSLGSFALSGGVASAGGLHTTIHWKVTAMLPAGGTTPITFSTADTFYATSNTSPIDPSLNIFYTSTGGSYTLPSTACAYTLSNSGTTTITTIGNQGSSGTNTITATQTSMTACNPVTLTVSGLPTGVTSNSPLSVTPITAGATATLTINVAATTVPNTYPITVTGTLTGNAPVTTSFNLVVNHVTPVVLVANLGGKSAWPEHHHDSVAKDNADTLFGKVFVNGTLYVYVVFTLIHDTTPLPIVLTTATGTCTVTLSPCLLSVDFKGISGTGLVCTTTTFTDCGKYSVSATVYYSTSATGPFAAGTHVKAFGFAVVA
jgi:hypothetical protein